MTNSAGTATSTTATLTVNPVTSGLPAPWVDADIGTPGVAGSASYSSGTFTVNGGGGDIWNTSDQFNYVYQAVSGNETIIARVASQQNTNSWAKAGVMVRDSLNANASYAFVHTTPGNGTDFQYRTADGASAQWNGQISAVAPEWVKLVITGTTVTGFTSPDGTTWTQIGSITVPLGSTYYVGLADTAHNNSVLSTDTFDNVSVSAAAATAPSITSQPASSTVTAGQQASFTVAATGTAPFSYQWQKMVSGNWNNVTNGGDITGATTATLSFSASVAADAGQYRVSVTNTAGNATSNTVTLTVNLAAPTGLTATAGNTQVALSWTAVSGATSYNVYRSTASGGEVKINTSAVTTTSYTDTGLTNGTQYFYEVTEVTGGVESGKSNEVSATPTAPPLAWTYDQTNAQQTSSATNSLSLGSASKAGDLVIVEVDWASTVNFSSITDNQGNTYVEVGTEQHSATFNGNSRLYYASNIKGGALTVTTQLSGAPSFHELYISEYSGLNATNTLDGFSVNVGTGSTFTSNNATTTAAGDLLYGIEIDSATASAAAGWTVRSSFDSNVAADKTATNVGSYAFTGNSSGGSIAWIAAFKLDPPASPNVTMGESNVLPTDDSGNANLLLAQKTTLARAATLQSLSFYVTQAAGKLRLGVYDSTGPGGGPGKLLAQTGEITPVVGWNTANVTTPVSLAAGTYWLAYLPSDNNLHFVKTSGAAGSGEFYSFAYGPLPSIFSTTPSTTSSHWSFYATLR